MVTNTGDAPLVVNQIVLDGGQAGNFSLTLPTLPATVAPGASLSVQARFAPSAAGQRTASLLSIDNAAGEHRTALRGTGQGPEASVAPNRVTFGMLAVGASLTRTVVLTNTGLAPVLVTSATITG